MTLKGSCPGWAQSSWALRKVVHFLCSSFSPPTSFWGCRKSWGGRPGWRGPAPSLSHWASSDQTRPRILLIGSCEDSPASRRAADLADLSHAGGAELLEEVELAGCLLEEEVDDLGRGDRGHEGGVRCGAGQRVRDLDVLRPPVKTLGWLWRLGPWLCGIPQLVGVEDDWESGRRVRLRVRVRLHVLGPQPLAESPGLPKGSAPCSQVLTVQPTEESVRLEDRPGAQRAHQDGLAAQEVVHGA